MKDYLKMFMKKCLSKISRDKISYQSKDNKTYQHKYVLRIST